MNKIAFTFLLISSALLLSCASDEAIEIEGTWDTNFAETETITSELWGANTVIDYDNDTNFAVTQNPSDAKFYPSKFSRVIWTEIASDSFHLCTVDFNLDSAEKAEMSQKTADAKDLDGKGCGGFAWTKYTLKK